MSKKITPPKLNLPKVDWEEISSQMRPKLKKQWRRFSRQATEFSSAFTGRIQGPAIVPKTSIAGRTLLSVIAIMTFLACLTFGGVMLIKQSANSWASDIATEVTIQIIPSDQIAIDDALSLANQIARQTPNIQSVDILSQNATNKLLEPWLGDNLQLADLPIPRIIVLGINTKTPPDLELLASEIKAQIPGASLDNHRGWVERLQAMANSTVLVGAVIFLLMLSATCLAAIFATQGALAGNREVVEVLHFVGARDEFIAREFQRHFFRQGLLGSVAGGAVAILAFILLGLWLSVSSGSAQAAQTSAFFGTFTLSIAGYVGIAFVAFIIALLTAMTARIAVLKHLENVYLAKLGENSA